MKIAFIVELAGTPRQGGEQRAMLNLASALSGENTTEIYSYQPSEQQRPIKSHFPKALKAAPFIRDIVVLPFLGFGLIRMLQVQFDVIVTSSTTIAALFRPKVKLVTICHIIRSQKVETLATIPKYRLLFNPLTYSLLSSLERRSLSHTSQIVVIRKHQRDFLVNKLGIDSNKIRVIPNGVDTEFFKPLATQKKNQIIFVGRGTIAKGLDILLEAAPSINCSILIVTQKIDPHLLQRANSLRNVRVILNAKPKELVRYYSESKAFILPSLDEEQPLTVMEAMACGLPVIVSKKAAADLLDNVQEGNVILNCLSVEEVARAANMTNTSDQEPFGVKNTQEILANYSLNTCVREFQGMLA